MENSPPLLIALVAGFLVRGFSFLNINLCNFNFYQYVFSIYLLLSLAVLVSFINFCSVRPGVSQSFILSASPYYFKCIPIRRRTVSGGPEFLYKHL